MPKQLTKPQRAKLAKLGSAYDRASCVVWGFGNYKMTFGECLDRARDDVRERYNEALSALVAYRDSLEAEGRKVDANLLGVEQ